MTTRSGAADTEMRAREGVREMSDDPARTDGANTAKPQPVTKEGDTDARGGTSSRRNAVVVGAADILGMGSG